MSGDAAFKQTILRCFGEGLSVPPAFVKLPARGFDAGAYRPGTDCPEPDGFSALWGAPPVDRVLRRGDWVYCTLSDGFYSALVRETLRVLPPMDGDRGDLSLNRALRLSKKGGTGCPSDPSAHRALLLALSAGDGAGARLLAQSALLDLYRDRPPRERRLAVDRSGALFDALGRFLSFV